MTADRAWYVLLFCAYAALNTSAMAAIKTAVAGFDVRKGAARFGWLGLGGALYLAALAVLLVLLKLDAASTVFPIAIGCTVLATNIVGFRIYGERLTAHKVGGTLLVLAGIVLTFMGAG